MDEADIDRRTRSLYTDCESVLRIDLCRRVARLEALCAAMGDKLEDAGLLTARLRSELRLMGVMD